MASAPPKSRSFTTRQHQPTLHSDPFWQATPRSNTTIAALMSAVQQVVPPITPSAASAAAVPQRPHRKPQCTHITVSRAYGQVVCSMCNRIPDLGFVYTCKQDELPRQHDPLPDVDAIPVVVPDDSGYFDTKARIAEYLQLSTSVVSGIRAGNYDVDQVDKLIAQREKVVRIIKQKESASNQNSVALTQAPLMSSDNVIASVGVTGAPTSTGINPSPLSASTPDHATTIRAISAPTRPMPHSTCSFQSCHACRPFFVDRMYASFESVLNGEFADLSVEEISRLPIMSRDAALRLGLPKSSPLPPRMIRSQQSADLSSHYADEADDEISVDWTQTTTNNGSESGSETLDSSALYPCPGPGHCPVWSRNSGCAYESGFDDGRRAMNHGFLAENEADRLTPDTSRSELHRILTDTPNASSTASSVSLPTPTTSPLIPLLTADEAFDEALQKQLGKIGKASSFGGEHSPNRSDSTLHGKSRSSSVGSEVEVNGGVALTEEAVKTHTPDIVTAN